MDEQTEETPGPKSWTIAALLSVWSAYEGLRAYFPADGLADDEEYVVTHNGPDGKVRRLVAISVIEPSLFVLVSAEDQFIIHPSALYLHVKISKIPEGQERQEFLFSA